MNTEKSSTATLNEWVLSLPEEDRKRLSAILLLTPFAKGYLEMAWDAAGQEGVRRAYASMPHDEPRVSKPLGYGRYKDDPEHIGCPRAKSDMTPCVARDGHTAQADDGVCVGCGENPADLLTDLVREVTKP